MKIDISRFSGRFRQETRDNLNIFDAMLGELDKTHHTGGEQFDTTIQELMRLTHAIKGGARMLGYSNMNDLCHNLESYLIAIRQHGRATRKQVDLIVEGRAAIERLIVEPFDTDDKSQEPHNWLMLLLDKLTTAAQKIADVEEDIAEPTPSRAPTATTAPPELQLQMEKKGWRDQSVRVNVEAIDDILLYGYELTQALDDLRKTHRNLDLIRQNLERIINDSASEGRMLKESDITQLLQNLTKISLSFRERIAEVDRNVRQIDSNASELRMRPISELFETVPLQVRELARELKKEVDVDFSGDMVRLDGRIVELLREPLLHIIRNAIDHGLEPPAERERAGKPRRGRLAIGAFENAGWARITIADDGAGIDLNYVWQRAKDLGLTHHLPSPETLPEGYKFLFDDRYTSRSSPTDISGRGVGMAAVKRRMQELRGDVRIESTPGFGTKIVLSMPTSLSSQRALIVQAQLNCKTAYFGLPTALIIETRSIKPQYIAAELHSMANSTLQPISLSRFFDGTITLPNEDETYSIMCSDGLHTGVLAVEQIIAESEVIVHPLPEVARSAEFIAGAAALTTEEMTLILNIPAMLTRMTMIKKSNLLD